MLNAGKRDYQQDRYLVLPDFKPKHGDDEQVNCCLVAVFDGHKSEQAAQIAKTVMPQILGERELQCCCSLSCFMCIRSLVISVSCPLACACHIRVHFDTALYVLMLALAYGCLMPAHF